MLSSDPEIFPKAESDCIRPRASERTLRGTLSATNVVAAPNMPPMPKPHRNRYARNSFGVRARPVNPEKIV